MSSADELVHSDNGHARAAQYSSSLRNYYPYSKFGGKYSNGMVAVEYMVDSNTSPALKRSGSNLPKLLDCEWGAFAERVMKLEQSLNDLGTHR